MHGRPPEATTVATARGAVRGSATAAPGHPRWLQDRAARSGGSVERSREWAVPAEEGREVLDPEAGLEERATSARRRPGTHAECAPAGRHRAQEVAERRPRERRRPPARAARSARPPTRSRSRASSPVAVLVEVAQPARRRAGTRGPAGGRSRGSPGRARRATSASRSARGRRPARSQDLERDRPDAGRQRRAGGARSGRPTSSRTGPGARSRTGRRGRSRWAARRPCRSPRTSASSARGRTRSEERRPEAAVLLSGLDEEHRQEPDALAERGGGEPDELSPTGVVSASVVRPCRAGRPDGHPEPARVRVQDVAEQRHQRPERARHVRPPHPDAVVVEAGVPDLRAGGEVVGPGEPEPDAGSPPRPAGAGHGRVTPAGDHGGSTALTPARRRPRSAPRSPRAPARPA